jgi:hypothetical protein
MKSSDLDRHLAVPSMKRLGSLRKRPFFHSKSISEKNTVRPSIGASKSLHVVQVCAARNRHTL